jgi:hypothetical protein
MNAWYIISYHVCEEGSITLGRAAPRTLARGNGEQGIMYTRATENQFIAHATDCRTPERRAATPMRNGWCARASDEKEASDRPRGAEEELLGYGRAVAAVSGRDGREGPYERQQNGQPVCER